MSKNDYLYAPLRGPRPDTYLIQSKRLPKLFVLHRRDPAQIILACAAIAARNTESKMVKQQVDIICDRNWKRNS